MQKSTITNNFLSYNENKHNLLKKHPQMIRILPEELIAKISAGEVVERPASIVKELIENSIDANASKITIEIENAGKKLIRVTDDGIGIPPDEITLALEKHATSKISSYEDIFHLKTMGFRGEALSSIGAVSNLKIESICKLNNDNPLGAGAESLFGKITGPFPSPIQNGTSVEVRDLFFNTPARMKFLKSDTTEKNTMLQVVQSLALANPGIHFEVLYDKKNILSFPAVKNTDDRIRDVLKETIFSKTIPFHQNLLPTNPIITNLSGRISALNTFVPSKNLQYLFINKRYIHSRTITKAIYDALKGILPTDKHPVFVIYLTVTTDAADVNVSPTKKEVKFSDENSVYHTIFTTVKKLFTDRRQITDYGFYTSQKDNHHLISDNTIQPHTYSQKSPHNLTAGQILSEELESKLQKNTLSQKEEKTSLLDELRHSKVKFIGEIFNGLHLVASDEENLYIIDAHAASERMLYEKYKKSLNDENPASQLLLSPAIINMPSDEFERVSQNLDSLNKLGWKIEIFGDNSFRCEGMPAILGDVGPGEILNAIFGKDTDGVEDIDKTTTNSHKSPLSDDYIIKKSCHAAVRGKDKLSFIEAQRLINELFLTSSYQTCPHGRPTVIRLRRDEILKKFGRK